MSDTQTPVPLSFRDAGKTFASRGGAVTAVEHASFDIGPGEFVCLLGPSGCGKSTLLNLAAGFEDPTSGRVLFRDEPVTGPGPNRGVVFQDSALFPWMTVLENLTFGPRMNGMVRQEAESRAADAVKAVGLTGFEGHHPSQLSGGMRQRVQIARALIMEPDVLLMDEPFGALDAQTRINMQQLLTQLWSNLRQAVLFITHDVEEAVYLADTVYVMSAHPGRIKQRIDINLARPRPYEITTTGEFNALKKQIFELIRQEHRVEAD